MPTSNKIKIGVVIPVLNGFFNCVKALTHIKTRHNWTPYIAPQWEDNKAISYVWNHYSEIAFKDGCKYCLILNDDAFLFRWAVDAMVDELQRVDNLHLVSGENTHTEHDVTVAEDLRKANLNFSCFMVTRQFFKVAGYFDENFYPAYFEDNDMHRRMILLGLPAYGISKAQFYHIGSATNNLRIQALGGLPAKQFQNNQSYYIRKWGGLPGYEKFDTPFNSGGSVKLWTYEDERFDLSK